MPLADSFGIPLNIQFTPQWGSEIIGDPVKLDKVRQWQMNGHEIGVHHHGIEAGSGWDGYTDHPPQDWTCPAKYKGTMADYMNILSQVGGDSLILNGGFGDTYDWPEGILFRTYGQAVEDAISQPVYENNNGQDCYAISYCVAFTETKVDSLITFYSSAGPDDIFGFNNHVFNFDFSTTCLRKWMEFIAGKNNKTIRQIMRERGLLTSVENQGSGELPEKGLELSQNYPNPFNPSTGIHFTLPEPSFVSLKIYDLLGKEIDVLISGPKQPGTYTVEWQAPHLPGGIYLYRLEAGNFVETKKMILQQ